MKCPNCGLEAPDGTAECPRCQIIFRKLEESAIKKSLLMYTARMQEPIKGTSSPLPWLIVLFFISALLYFDRLDEKQPAPAANPVVQAEPAAAQPESGDISR